MKERILILGSVGNFGTLEIIKEKWELLSHRFSSDFLRELENEIEEESTILNNLILDQYDKYKEELFKVSNGGVLSALWNFCEKEKRGLEYSLKDIPIMQGTIEVCEIFKINPYRLLCFEVYILKTDIERANEILQSLHNNNINANIIGELTNRKERIRIDNEEKSFLTKEQKDEIDKVLPNYIKIMKKKEDNNYTSITE
ncbi:MAG: hypothetical protein Q4F88_02010 [Eubacteriales bacterium]|nr:hypothetical protein [Eubacteriales bacterium]